MRVEAIHRRGLRDIQRLALRDSFGDVEHHHIAQFLQPDEVSQRSADLTGTNQGNLVARHGKLSFESRRRRGRMLGWWLSLSRGPFKPVSVPRTQRSV